MIVVAVVQNKGITMAAIKEHVGNIKNGIPSSFTSHEYDEVHTFQDPNFYDYIKLANFTKKTGIELDGFHSFAFKELVDNAADFLETYYKEYPLTIRVYLSNDIATGFRIAVINPNDKDIQIFPISNLKKTFFIEKYREYMKPGDMLPLMSELDAILTTDELLDETKAILDMNIKPFFNEAVHKIEVVDKLKSRQDEIQELLKKKVKFIDEDEQE